MPIKYDLLFVYRTPAGIVITPTPHREFRNTHPTAELLTTGKSLTNLRRYCEVQGWSPVTVEGDTLVLYRDRLSPEYRERLQFRSNRRRRGEQHHFFGLPRSKRDRESISRGMRGKNVGSNNTNWGKPRADEDKRKIGRGKRLQFLREVLKRKWCVDPDGNEHFVPGSFTLPTGWRWGRVRGKKRHRERKKTHP
jgi:hypothetical protein